MRKMAAVAAFMLFMTGIVVYGVYGVFVEKTISLTEVEGVVCLDPQKLSRPLNEERLCMEVKF